jgi:hypothetical protein
VSRNAAWWLALFSWSALASVDRIDRMNATERCIYTAQLSVAGYHYFLQGKARTEVPIHWHGDETQNEIDFVNFVLDATFASAERDRHEHPQQAPLSEQSFGDRAYRACMSATQS